MRPDAQANAKRTGDTHPPDVESDLPFEPGGANAPTTGQASESGPEGRPGRGKKAGVLKDEDDEASDSYGSTHDSGESDRS